MDISIGFGALLFVDEIRGLNETVDVRRQCRSRRELRFRNVVRQKQRESDP